MLLARDEVCLWCLWGSFKILCWILWIICVSYNLLPVCVFLYLIWALIVSHQISMSVESQRPWKYNWFVGHAPAQMQNFLEVSNFLFWSWICSCQFLYWVKWKHVIYLCKIAYVCVGYRYNISVCLLLHLILLLSLWHFHLEAPVSCCKRLIFKHYGVAGPYTCRN